ncbi:hypothetical protein BJ138DRAFT_1141775 [Hygrophoropsis aurantiaca]|uniref:Uncharacterized protein n=1 Tax=Hygrophoropsis aurantiaca TaxID=72124 RepID=A0ACB8AR14_9AGAM|nr:hypothetical protein BJ138DRAFT_1141775 [Hygrophoropsis aurantiaca]
MLIRFPRALLLNFSLTGPDLFIANYGAVCSPYVVGYVLYSHVVFMSLPRPLQGWVTQRPLLRRRLWICAHLSMAEVIWISWLLNGAANT